MYKTYILKKSVSRYELQVAPGKFICFSTIGYGTNYSSGFPRYSTSDNSLQEVIESSSLFKEGVITLYNSVEIGKISATTVTESKAPIDDDNDTKIYGEVTTFKAAREILTSVHGASQNSVSNAEKVFEKAEELGVSFPNLK